MSSTTRSAGRALWVSLRAMILFTLILGIGYTLLIWAVGLAMPAQANGSLLRDASGNVVGSALIGPSFADADGKPMPQYFQPRPSAAGDGYDGGASSGSNLGPESPDLLDAIAERQAEIAAVEGVPPAAVPADAVTASGSGLDPDISPEYAQLQVDRVAAARGLPADRVRALVEAQTRGRELGYLGEPTVNVLELNLALDRMEG